MAAKGTEAKAFAVQKIKEAFGANFIGEYDKKLYIECPEAGGIVQVAISLTCPKIPVAFASSSAAIPTTKDGGMDFENMTIIQNSTVELTQDEQDNIKRLLAMVE